MIKYICYIGQNMPSAICPTAYNYLDTKNPCYIILYCMVNSRLILHCIIINQTNMGSLRAQ